jgi:Putative F0F1-ATPase subunit Ca2+/Mg2+ transporter
MVSKGQRCLPSAHRGLEVDKERPGITQFWGLGMLNALCLGAGMVAGWFVDQALGTLPLFLFIGMVLGIAVGVLATRSEIKRFF